MANKVTAQMLYEQRYKIRCELLRIERGDLIDGLSYKFLIAAGLINPVITSTGKFVLSDEADIPPGEI